MSDPRLKGVPETVEALGYRWTLEHNTELAEFERDELEARARHYVFSTLTRPSEQAAAFDLLFPYYPFILSSVTKVEAIEGSEMSQEQLSAWFLRLFYAPEMWLEYVQRLRREKRDEDVIRLTSIAAHLNPQWKEKEEAEAALFAASTANGNDDLSAALIVSEAALVALSNGGGSLEPDEIEAAEAAKVITEAAEGQAKKKGASVLSNSIAE